MFENKVVWITGASSGIGEALAIEFASAGAKLILSARREDTLDTVKEKCNAAANQDVCLVLPLDITDEASLAGKVQAAHAWNGQIDMLINNAGISQRSSCVETEMSTYRTIFEVDVFGQIALTKLVLPIMIEQNNGHLAVTSSVAGKIGVPFRTGYSAAKHAVMGFFDALRTEINQHNIKVTTITPGFIKTNIAANAVSGDGTAYNKQDNNINNGMAADACAKVIIKGLSKGKPEIAVGVGIEMQTLWIKRFFPNVLFKLMVGQYKKVAKKNNAA